MQLVNEKTKKQIARLSALTLIFSYVELLIPRIIPFFRLGLGNTVMLMGLGTDFTSGLNFVPFMFLCILKTISSNLMGGTLFSAFFIVSFVQSVVSAFVMFVLNYIKKRFPKYFSLYGISIVASAISAFVQIFISSLYIGQGTWKLFGVMLIFNVASGIVTAWLAENLQFDVKSLDIKVSIENNNMQQQNLKIENNKNINNYIFICFLLIVSVSVFFIKNLYALGIIFILALISQKIIGRKILIFPHISLWLFIFISSLFVPNGKVIFSFWNFSVTQGALISAIQKALRLSAVSAFSQCATKIKPKENTILGLTLNYYKTMCETFENTQGSIFSKIKTAFFIQ